MYSCSYYFFPHCHPFLVSRTNFPDPLASKRTPEAAGQLYESAGLRYVWMPTEDMSDACRKLAVAQCALILDALIQVVCFPQPTSREKGPGRVPNAYVLFLPSRSFLFVLSCVVVNRTATAFTFTAMLVWVGVLQQSAHTCAFAWALMSAKSIFW